MPGPAARSCATTARCAIITNNVIIDNFADMDGGGIALYYADCTISNNVIARNYALVGGGIMNWDERVPDPEQHDRGNKPSAMHLEAIPIARLAARRTSRS